MRADRPNGPLRSYTFSNRYFSLTPLYYLVRPVAHPLQISFPFSLAQVKAVKIEEQRKEREELQRRSLEIFGTVKPGKRSEKEVEEVSSWLSRMRLGGEVRQAGVDERSNLKNRSLTHTCTETEQPESRADESHGERDGSSCSTRKFSCFFAGRSG